MIIPVGYSNVTFVILRSGDLDPYTTSFGVELTDSGSFDPVQAATDALAFGNAAKPNLAVSDTIQEIDWAYNTGLGVTEAVSVLGIAGSLAAGSSILPQNCAALLQKRSPFPGRKGRGRMYWPTLAEADVDPVGNLTGTAITRLVTMLSSWKSTCGSSPQINTQVLFHSTGDVGTSVPYPINIGVSPLMATQRRRLRR